MLERIRKKDGDAIRRLYAEYAPKLMAICHRYVPERADAEDVLQESFIRIIDKIGTYRNRGEGTFEAWMARIAVNVSIDWLRKRKRLDVEPLQENQENIVDEEEPSYDSLSQEEIQAAIRSLPDGYRTVLNLYVFEDKSHREIASLLGISERTSASQLHRARNYLWKLLKAKKK